MRWGHRAAYWGHWGHWGHLSPPLERDLSIQGLRFSLTCGNTSVLFLQISRGGDKVSPVSPLPCICKHLVDRPIRNQSGLPLPTPTRRRSNTPTNRSTVNHRLSVGVGGGVHLCDEANKNPSPGPQNAGRQTHKTSIRPMERPEPATDSQGKVEKR